MKAEKNSSSGNRLFVALAFFLIIFSFAYVFSGIAGVNVPRYYPNTGEWLFEKLADEPSMGYYGKVAFVLPIAVFLALICYLAYPRWSKRLHMNAEYFKGAAVISMIWAIMFYVGEEGHSWALGKMDLTGGGFWNHELAFFVILILFFLALLKVFLLVDREMEGK